VETNLPHEALPETLRGMKAVRITEDAIPTILVKQCDAKPKRISSLMEKLYRKLICMSNNREI